MSFEGRRGKGKKKEGEGKAGTGEKYCGIDILDLEI